jgi:hypothetical protein
MKVRATFALVGGTARSQRAENLFVAFLSAHVQGAGEVRRVPLDDYLAVAFDLETDSLATAFTLGARLITMAAAASDMRHLQVHRVNLARVARTARAR